MLKRLAPRRADRPAIPIFEVPINENGFVDWLVDAEPGSSLVYYRGHLAHDRMASTKVLEASQRSALNAVASRAMAAAESGFVLLVQKRLGFGDALYIAVRTRSSLKRPRPRLPAPHSRGFELRALAHSARSFAIAA